MNSLEQIRRLVRDSFQQLGAKVDLDPRETVLIQDGYYCGRRFDCDGLRAVWFAEENELKLYDHDGNVSSSYLPEDTEKRTRVA